MKNKKFLHWLVIGALLYASYHFFFKKKSGAQIPASQIDLSNASYTD